MHKITHGVGENILRRLDPAAKWIIAVMYTEDPAYK